LQPAGFVGTDEREQPGALKLWPNPARAFVKVALPDSNEFIEYIEIYDLQGRTVRFREPQHRNEIKIEIGDLPTGMYLVRAVSAARMYTQKLVVE